MGTLSGYSHCVEIAIPSSSDGELTNYQVKFTLVKSNGSNSGSTVYLNNDCLNWPYDVRFTASDGETLLDFAREEYDGIDGTWWVKVPTIPASGGATIRLYTGKAAATDASNAANTFRVYRNYTENIYKEISTGNEPYGALRDGDFLYLTLDDGAALEIYDVSDLSSISKVGEVISKTYLNEAHDLVKIGNYVFVAAHNPGYLVSIDVSDPEHPSIADTFADADTPGLQSIVYPGTGNYIFGGSYSTGKLISFNVSNPTNILKVSSVTVNTESGTPRFLLSYGNYVFISKYNGGGAVECYNVSNPSSMTYVDSIAPAGMANSGYMAINGTTLYVSDENNDGIQSINISNPASLSALQFYSHIAMDGARGCYVFDGSLYVAGLNSNDIAEINISNPSSMSLVRCVRTAGYPGTIYIDANGYMFVPCWSVDKFNVIYLAGDYYSDGYGCITTNGCLKLYSGNSTLDSDVASVHLGESITAGSFLLVSIKHSKNSTNLTGNIAFGSRSFSPAASRDDHCDWQPHQDGALYHTTYKNGGNSGWSTGTMVFDTVEQLKIKWLTAKAKFYQNASLLTTKTTYIPDVACDVWLEETRSGYEYIYWVAVGAAADDDPVPSPGEWVKIQIFGGTWGIIT